MKTTALLLLTALALPALAADRPGKAAFDKLKSLVGVWEGENQKGMHEKLEYQLIAGDTVLMDTSHIDYHPGVAMVTMYHLDGPQLMLTHYCVAGNQPRLSATAAPDENNLVFTFRDGTNIKTRDVGHMDSVKLRFIDKDHYTSRWSFYAKGKETWFEEFAYHRVK